MRTLPALSMLVRLRQPLLGLFIAVLTAFVMAQPLTTVAERFPSGSIRSIAEADAALAEAARERADIEARFLQEEQACHPKFFATSCIEQAKERRRRSISALRPIEIEANTFKRQARVEARDKTLAERVANDEKARQERAGRLQPSESTPRDVPQLPPMEPGADVTNDSSRKAQATLFSDRSNKHVAKLTRLQAEDEADVKKRAENIAAYEKKRQDALARQQKVAERKAEKERKRKRAQDEDATTKPE